MNKIKSFIGVMALSVFLSGCIGPWAAQPADRMKGTQPEETSIEDTSMMYEGEGAPVAENLKEYVVTATDFAYDMSEILVNQGDTVRIVFVNSQGTHDFNIDEYGMKTRILAPGESETIEFVASTPGSFEFYCSVGNHRQMGMKGVLTVQ